MRLALTLMRRVLKFAERRDLVQRNVANAVEAPAGPTKPSNSITPNEARRIGPMITLSLHLGQRPGEVARLTRGAIDLDATPPVLHAAHSLQHIDEQIVLGPVKTATSNRTIALPPACVAALERQTEPQSRERHRDPWEWKNPLDLVFATEVGTPLIPSNVRSRPSPPARARTLPPPPPAPRCSEPHGRSRHANRGHHRHPWPPIDHHHGRDLPAPDGHHARSPPRRTLRGFSRQMNAQTNEFCLFAIREPSGELPQERARVAYVESLYSLTTLCDRE